MTKFSTTVAYIEPPRRESVWSATTESLPSSPIRKTPSTDSLKRTRFSDTVHVCEGEASRGPQEWQSIFSLNYTSTRDVDKGRVIAEVDEFIVVCEQLD